jgi:hypothetical protein
MGFILNRHHAPPSPRGHIPDDRLTARRPRNVLDDDTFSSRQVPDVLIPFARAPKLAFLPSNRQH